VTKAAGPGEPPQALVQAIKRLLRPLLKVFIAHGFTLPILTQLLKELYVEVAEAEFPLPGRPQTDSRISLLTGVHRKDIRVLRGRGPTPDLPPAAISRNAQMIALWAGAPEYRDASGAPLPLPKTGKAPSFESMALSVSTDIRARVVLDEWLRLGIVRIDDEGLIHLNNAAFIPREDFAELSYYFGRNLRDHIAASAHNLSGNQPPMLERAVYYDGLTPESAAELAALSRETGQKALVEVNKKAFELCKQDAGAEAATLRISFGVYFFSASAGTPDGSEDSGS
jgi:Family of unknown function (DUF6502)